MMTRWRDLLRGLHGPGDPHDERVIAWRVSVSIACLIIVAVGAAILISMSIHRLNSPELQAMRLLSVLVAGAVLGYLFLRREHFTTTAGTVMLVLMMLPLFPLLWQLDAELLALGHPFAPFSGNKQAMIALAILAPTSLPVGCALVVALSSESVLAYYLTGMASSPAPTTEEPWVTVIYGLICVGLLLYRSRHRVLERELYRTRAEVESLEHLARMLLALRDRANTPLQIIELAQGILLRRFPQAEEEVERTRAALRQLRDLSAGLAGAEGLVTWQSGEESFDSNQLLRPLSTRSRPGT